MEEKAQKEQESAQRAKELEERLAKQIEMAK
jgi:hypothetical protein